MKEIIDYILKFLLNGNDEMFPYIGYTADTEQFSQYKAVIVPSGFFERNIYRTPASMPALPLKIWEGVPLLFGEPQVQWHGETLVLKADIVASSFFLLSRYEELINENRDEHGRFLAKESVPAHANFLHRPVVDEYGRAFRNLLRNNGIQLPEDRTGIDTIYLTHDVDVLAHYRNFRSVLGAILHFRHWKMAFSTFFGKIENDHWYSFPYLFKKDNLLKNRNIKIICFVLKANKIYAEDRTNFTFGSKDFKRFVTLCKKNHVEIGLHSSYAAGQNPRLINDEKIALEFARKRIIFSHRSHYLCSNEPRDFARLIRARISDDFTMAYADCAGFRLGTCRSVQWIDADKMQLTSLILHPLTVMDKSLSEQKYMNLSENEAFDTVKNLIDTTHSHGGELTLLWHNTSVAEPYHRNLYAKIIDYLKDM